MSFTIYQSVLLFIGAAAENAQRVARSRTKSLTAIVEYLLFFLLLELYVFLLGLDKYFCD